MLLSWCMDIILCSMFSGPSLRIRSESGSPVSKQSLISSNSLRSPGCWNRSSCKTHQSHCRFKNLVNENDFVLTSQHDPCFHPDFSNQKRKWMKHNLKTCFGLIGMQVFFQALPVEPERAMTLKHRALVQEPLEYSIFVLAARKTKPWTHSSA